MIRIGQFLAGGLIPILVTGNAVFMYRLLGIIIPTIFLIFTLITYFGVKENTYRSDNEEKVNLKKMFKILLGNDQLILVSIVILLHTIATELFLAFGINFFYFEFGYGGIQMTIFTVRPFMTKLGAALQQGIVTLILVVSGIFTYSQRVAELEIQKGQGIIEDISGQADLILSRATPTMLLILRIGMGLIPMISMIIAYILIKNKYKITEEKYDEILSELERG